MNQCSKKYNCWIVYKGYKWWLSVYEPQNYFIDKETQLNPWLSLNLVFAVHQRHVHEFPVEESSHYKIFMGTLYNLSRYFNVKKRGEIFAKGLNKSCFYHPNNRYIFSAHY